MFDDTVAPSKVPSEASAGLTLLVASSVTSPVVLVIDEPPVIVARTVGFIHAVAPNRLMFRRPPEPLDVAASASLKLSAFAEMSPDTMITDEGPPRVTATVGVPVAVDDESLIDSSPPPAFAIPANERSWAFARTSRAPAPLAVPTRT